MHEYPLVSIITPSYNQGQFIEATIESVLGQTYGNIEYIILDGMSTDSTADVLERYHCKVTRIIRESDEGQSDAIVKGFKLALGKLVGWINSDDILYPDCVEKIVLAYRKDPDAVLFYNSQINILSENGTLSRRDEVPMVNGDSLLRLCNTLIQPGSFYRSDALAKVNYFDKSLRYSMDLDLWLRLLKVGHCVNIGGEPVAGYREWDGTKTSTGDSRLLRERRKMLISHGARTVDKAIIVINWGLFKIFVKKIPFIGGVCKALVRRLFVP